MIEYSKWCRRGNPALEAAIDGGATHLMLSSTLFRHSVGKRQRLVSKAFTPPTSLCWSG